MALYRLVDPTNAFYDAWFFGTVWDVQAVTTTSVRLLNLDGTFTLLQGADIGLDQANEPTAGQITSAVHLAPDGVTVLEQISLFSQPLTAIRAVYEDTFAVDPSFSQLVLAGNDVVIGAGDPGIFRNAVEYIFSGAGNDIVYGGGGSNLFFDSAGNDIYIGAQHTSTLPEGFDFVYFGLSGGSLRVTLAGSPGSFQSRVIHLDTGEIDTLVNIDGVNGSDFGDEFFVSANFISHAGNRIAHISLGAGNDIVHGNGHTFLDFGGPTAVTVDLDAGTAQASNPADAPFRGFDVLSGVNAVRGTSASDTLLGSNGLQAEVFVAFGAAADFIDGRGGVHDRYSFWTAGADRIVDLSNPVGTSTSLGVLRATLLNIEDVEAGSGNDLVTMSAADNLVFGNAGNDMIRGLAGNDVLYGDFGPDPYGLPHFLPGDPGWESESVPGNDTLIGGMGRDIMTGGGGADTFQFNSILESGKTRTTRDVITDFAPGTDHIDLSGIDARLTTLIDDAFVWRGTSAFTGIAGQLHYFVQDSGHDQRVTIIEGDVNGDRVADFQIELTGQLHLTAWDFIL
jgi:serralysin